MRIIRSMHGTMLTECGIDTGLVWTDAYACIFIFVCIPLSNKGVQVTNLHHPSHHKIQYQYMVQVIVFSCIIVEHVPQLVLLKIHYDVEQECRKTQ